eukprot:Sspe_Gene.14634::Locus_5071_Transcript_1_1_Confidence_1.000_Length_1736::g.14634::m.14634
MTDSWQLAKVVEPFNPAALSDNIRKTWVLVEMQHKRWASRRGESLDLSDTHNTQVRVHPCDIIPTRVNNVADYVPSRTPQLSFVVVRWGGMYPVPEHSDDGAFGGWGNIGTCVCDKYIRRFFERVYLKLGPSYEVLSIFICQSSDLDRIQGPSVAGMMRAQRKAGCYYLWPVAWQDGHGGQPGYVEKDAFFRMMRSMEAAGVASRHPHPSNLYYQFASKNWTSTMCLCPRFHVPITIKVNRALLLQNPMAAATNALRAMQALQGDSAETDLNKIRGVAKLGFSWEAQDVYGFVGVKRLASRLERLVEQAGLECDSVFVQEHVENDCEIRAYLIDGEIKKCLYSRFCEQNDNGGFTSFRRLDNREEAIEKWFGGNSEGLDAAENTINKLVKRWLLWMRAESCDVPPACRMDFFVKLNGPTATVMTGELTEQGASTLGWEDGPTLTFDAVIRACIEATPPENVLISSKRQRRTQSYDSDDDQ